ncbi:MAG: ATP-binding protein, partial [Gloeotrichia echinulata HAB0833]
AKALYFGFNTLKGQILEKVVIEEITSDIQPKSQKISSRSQDSTFINFKIIGSENGKKVKIGVSVIQSSQITLTAALKRLIQYENFGLTRGCLIRSQSKIEQMRKNSEAYKLLNELILVKGGEHVDLLEEQIRPLIAVLAVYKNRQKYQLTEENIFDFISKTKITFDNLLLREILSDPSGNMPDIDDEDIISESGLFDSSSLSETDDSDELSELFN